MKKLYVIVAFLCAIGASLLLAPMSHAAVHHASVAQKIHSSIPSPGTRYYTLSTRSTSDFFDTTPQAARVEVNLTVYINADNTFTGTIVDYSYNGAIATLSATGSFQPDGSINLHFFGPYLNFVGTAQIQKFGIYVGTYSDRFGTQPGDSGTMALVPVEDPTSTSISFSALITSTSDQGTGYGGVIVLDHSGHFGTLRLQDGRVVPVFTKITSSTITFFFLPGKLQFVSGNGTFGAVGLAYRYDGTFAGPNHDDTGNWYGYPLSFAS